MPKLKQFVLSVLICIFVAPATSAFSESIVISQVQLGNVSSANNEFVEIFNNSPQPIDLTNWCLHYASATNASFGDKMTCLTTGNDNLHLFLPGKSYGFFVSNQLQTANPSLGFDGKFAATLAGAGGHLRVMDGDQEIDKLGWGSGAINGEGGMTAPTAPNGKVISRKVSTDMLALQDTDNNANDFEIVDAKIIYQYGKIYEVQDVCTNLDDIQEIIPEGYISNEQNDCVMPPVDVCTNLDDMQLIIPIDYLFDVDGNCQPDMCKNIDGLQTSIPEGYIESDDQSCITKQLPLSITEVLPNAIGLDDGNEFIEIYNPNSNVVYLGSYEIVVDGQEYKLEDFDIPLGARERTAFYNSDLNFTLVNSGSVFSIRSTNGSFVSESLAYSGADEGGSWALIEGVWQYTNQITPGKENLKSLILVVETVEIESALVPCGPDQYRNPETNRCKNIIYSTTSSFVPCQEGYERNPVTNRCRKITFENDSLVPCQNGYERNAETNRCRKITSVLGASDLIPCKTGYERNPETNRCRKIIASSVPKADYKPEQPLSTNNSMLMTWSLVSLVTIAIGYGVWEWRKDIAKLVKNISIGIHLKK